MYKRQGIDINIDGKISSYKAQQLTNLSNSGYNTVSKTIYTSSKNTVVIPYEVLEKMVSAKNCRLRIHTTEGNQDIDFSAASIPGGKATAIVSIKEFMTKVAKVKQVTKPPLQAALHTIYHNIRCVHRLRGSQGVSDGKPVKQATNHPKTRQKRPESL